MDHACQHASETTGTSTACIVSLVDNQIMGCNLGDSGFIIIRNREIILKSEEQQMSFNQPYQIGTGSDMLPRTHATLYTEQALEGDYVILGSDGLFDNLYLKKILDKFNKMVIKGFEVSKIAQKLAQQAYTKSRSMRVKTPFSDSAKKHGLKIIRGGKMDDITVVVGRVVVAE
eukprot:TRINITY_DN2285_c2_g1_i1.p1 TRINITY_DN2285_c2_g1~~TRINITY_DN2285_c2_g1_i1.p1  ORF type:complete len:173 (-),score=31.31 TRINITY_DN2285_c2_g1_i1:40-558(-)